MFLRLKRRKETAIPAPNSSEFGIADKLSNLWSSPLEQLPVYKDLPRLAQRITVSGTLNNNLESEVEEEPTEFQFGIWIKTDLPDNFYKYAIFTLL